MSSAQAASRLSRASSKVSSRLSRSVRVRAGPVSPSKEALKQKPSTEKTGQKNADDLLRRAMLLRAKRQHDGRDVVLFSSPECAELARAISEAGGDRIKLGAISWKTFRDGYPDLFVEDAEAIRDRHVAFLASFHSPEVIFEQLSIIYALPKMFVASFSLVLPFFPTGTLERVEDEGEVATAYTLSRILSNVPISRGGPTPLLIFDIHALQERFYFGDSVLPCFLSGIPLLLAKLRSLEDADNVVIAYPDEGAWKRFRRLFGGSWDEIVCTKVRDGERREVRLKEGDPQGRHCVIVDDMVQSGGTLIECQRVLAKAGAEKVSAFATHAVFPKGAWKAFTEEDFTNFWVTDSCIVTAETLRGRKPFEVLSIAPEVAESLLML